MPRVESWAAWKRGSIVCLVWFLRAPATAEQNPFLRRYSWASTTRNFYDFTSPIRPRFCSLSSETKKREGETSSASKIFVERRIKVLFERFFQPKSEICFKATQRRYPWSSIYRKFLEKNREKRWVRTSQSSTHKPSMSLVRRPSVSPDNVWQLYRFLDIFLNIFKKI